MLRLAPNQESVWVLARRMLGVLLALHFLTLLPYSTELFSTSGWLPDHSLDAGIPLGFFRWLADPIWVKLVLAALALAAAAFACGFAARGLALALWLGLTSLLSRNRLYYDLDLDYLGWLLFAFALLPLSRAGEIRGDADRGFAGRLYWGAWLLLAVTYSVSGISKCFTEEWRSGEMVGKVLDSSTAWFPLSIAAKEILDWPLRFATWGVVAIETLALPLLYFARARKPLWVGLTLFQLGIALTTRITEVNFAVLLFHAFVFDPRWVPAGLRKSMPAGQN